MAISKPTFIVLESVRALFGCNERRPLPGVIFLKPLGDFEHCFSVGRVGRVSRPVIVVMIKRIKIIVGGMSDAQHNGVT